MTAHPAPPPLKVPPVFAGQVRAAAVMLKCDTSVNSVVSAMICERMVI